MMQILYRLFAKVTKKNLIGFLFKRLPFYLIGLLILTVWGVKGVMFTFFVVMAFFLGWISNKIIAAVADYRLTQRLNRVHFTHVEFDAMRRERDLAIQAFQHANTEKSRGGKAAPMPPRPLDSQIMRYSPEEIREYVRQNGLEEEQG